MHRLPLLLAILAACDDGPSAPCLACADAATGGSDLHASLDGPGIVDAGSPRDGTSARDALGDGASGNGDAGSLPLQGHVVTVADFTETAIVAAIAAARPGDTVYFPTGTYEITSTLALAGAVLYHGEPGARLHAAGGITIARADAAQVNGISLDGLTFDGGNLILTGDKTAFSSHVTMVHCTVENVPYSTSFAQSQGVLLDHIEQSRFDYNTFTGDAAGGASYALIGYALNDTSISHNKLENTYQGFHFESADSSGGNRLDVSYNTARGLLAIGIELNKFASNSRVVGNHLDGWMPGNANGMGLSIVPTGTANVVEYNYVSGAGCSTCNIGIEANGSNSYFEYNTVDGFYTNIAISCAPGTIFADNALSNAGMWGTFDRDGGYCAGAIIGTNDINGVATTGYTL